MALVQCPECANQVSDQATACPKCGYPLAVTQKPNSPVTTRTAATAQTGSFWLCPSCGKHVPTRQAACACGLARPQGGALPIASPRPATTLTPQFHEPERETPWKAIATLCVGGLVLAGAFKISMEAAKQPAPKDSKLLGALALPTEPARQEGYFLPVPPGAPLTQQPGMQPSPGAATEERRPPSVIQVGPTEAQFREEQERQERRQADQLQRQQEMADRQQQDQWRREAAALLADLRRTLGAYKYQLCAEVRGGITLSTPRDTRGEYSAAIAAARGFEDSARAAGVKEWVRIEWSEFPPPEERRSEPRTDSVLLRKWNCPM